MKLAARVLTRFLSAAASVSLLIFATAAPAPAQAQSFHAYSIARDYTSVAYTGLYSYRYDQVPTSGQNPGPCPAIPYQGNPLYYTQWVIIRQDAGGVPLDFVELGLAHACVGQKYWYWGYQWNGGWYPLGEDWAPTLGRTNYYDIHRLGEVWYWDINGQNRHTMYWNAVGIRVETGLESYNANATTNYINHSGLQKTLSEGPWVYWSNAIGIKDAGMCGSWVDSQTWRTKQGTPC